MTTRGQDIVSVIKQQIEQFGLAATMVDTGTVTEVGDGIAWVYGLAAAKYNELLQFPNDIVGIAMNLEEDSVAVVIVGDASGLKEGDEVRCTGRIAEVPVGEALIGRVVDPLGRPMDGKGVIKSDKTRPLEQIAPNVAVRQAVNTPVQTGIKAIDSLIPIGRGQRELIIGDRSTGKTAITLDTIINQKGGDLICIYVAIGQKTAQVARVVATLEQYGVMEHTVVVAANAADSVALQYLAPYAGCAIGEGFMEQGKDCLVVYDDLSKHAWSYRQLSLLLRRPPGREAYPGDVFYLHSRLLERAAKLDDKHGGGSLTALPIIETQAGDVSAYIPTNVISITDGQIYLEADLFNAGQRPALNVGLSVSRVGSSAQTKAMRRVAGRLRLELAQYRELAAFAQFGTSELDPATRTQLERGRRVAEVLKQLQFSPMPVEKQVMILYAAINGYLDDVPIERVSDFEVSFHQFMSANHSDLGRIIAEKKEITPETEEALKAAILKFKEGQK
ncbi:MAG: F0F1 ATP synthase subunit alpha [Dehalococcoidales bacterium]|jgi:F-type H+-transporting ATPase subunit alpha|nr:F0F1 ATP synthase subunit alpha [Dehalococcoidales bacterium]MDP6738285.1 F0F1 ATP synthase subunit alpha [Dehalococcoidales bacterium]|tara:strand:+ start:820 stop:2328 length:1509 start_codon:yes stop_codon:yes gene_type:complete